MAATPNEPTDDEILARYRDGDRGAFDELVRLHRPAVVQMVRRYVKNAADAEDVTQQSFVRAYEHLATFRGEASIRSWLFRISIHSALSFLRGQPREEGMEVDDIAAFTSSLDTSKLVASEVWAQVAALIAVLPAKQRLVLELRLFHELSFAEVAAIADCTEEAARGNYHLAVKKLKDKLPSGRR